GKSTAFLLLQEGGAPIPFVNADLIGKVVGAAPSPDVLAQQIAEVTREHFLNNPTTFATETVFSDEVGSKLGYLQRAAEKGFRVVLLAVWIPSAALSIARVRRRVANGGHAVPEAKLARRYVQCMKNLQAALGFVEAAVVLDNSGAIEEGPKLVATLNKGRVIWTAANLPKGIADLLPGGGRADT
ncbi:Predicted ABC-type ATPase, partial [Paracidovorax wautersii]